MTTAQQNNRILIVEDDAGMRGLMAKHFRRKGYEVEQAEAAEEVVARFGENSGRFDVVVTDVHLPGESGVDLARRIKEMRPEQQVVFMTGDADATIAQRALRGGAAGYLVKPFEFFELDAVVNHAVTRGAFVQPENQPVARVASGSAHVTMPAKVVLAPARRTRHTRLAGRARVALAAAAMITLAWLAGNALAPAPVSAAAAVISSAAPDNKPVVVPIVIERSVYLK
jgi:DNA-binding response OmpR family regulator